MQLKILCRGYLILLCHFNYFILVNSNVSSKPIPEFIETDKRVEKRNQNDFQTCLDNFDIHQDKIIRTQDSRSMGAKYLNERDVSSRDECLRLCCETESCDVFVFEEKSPGSCYLFECGTPEDFKCKFTKHQNYTSAVLAVNRQLTELESQIKFTQHEHELTKLREPSAKVNIPAVLTNKITTPSPKTKEVADFGILPTNPNIQQGKGCSKYQFECHTSKECIAIYNACDGIPQCADGSDEAQVLGCPTQPSTVLPSKLSAVTVLPASGRNDPSQENYSNVENRNPDHQEVPVLENVQTQWPQHPQYVAESAQVSSGFSQNVHPGNNQLINLQNSRAGYGREGEGMINYHQDPQWNPQYHQNQGGSQIFTHKGNGLVPHTDRYQQQRPYGPQEGPSRLNGGYNEPVPNDLSKYYYENMPYRMFPQNQQPNWQTGHRLHDDLPANHLETQSVSGNNGMAPDYYYEEPFRNRGQPYVMQQQPVYSGQGNRGSFLLQQQQQANTHEVHMDKVVPKAESVKKEGAILTTVLPTVISKTDDQNHGVKTSHRKISVLSAESKTKETVIENEIDGHNTSPSGAILSLAMGLCITTIMLVLVGCRMKMVRKRMRRGGKSSYAHDADFLVNGMYL